MVSQMMTLPSLLELANFLHEPSKCNGSQAKAVMNFVCLAIVVPTCLPVFGSQMMIFPDLSPEATLVSFGDQARANTHPGCPLHSKCGVSVVKSQNLTVESPEPDTKYLPDEENEATKTSLV